MYLTNQILFPEEVIARLENLRGEEWAELVREVIKLPKKHPKRLGFCLAMIRDNGCMSCQTDGYRAIRGCEVCSITRVRRDRRTDTELIQAVEEATRDVMSYLSSKRYLASKKRK